MIANCVNQICHTWLPHDKLILDQFVNSICFWQRTVWNVHNKLVHVLLYDIFVHYFGMISRYWDENILYFFNIEKKLFWTKKSFFLYFISKLSWYHPKISNVHIYENILQKCINKFIELIFSKFVILEKIGFILHM